MKTKVIFLFEKDSEDVFAYFPEEIADYKGNRTCYAHIGQHSACSPAYASECRLAPQSAYSDLRDELQSLSPEPYDLDILNEKQFEYRRGPTAYEIKFGEGATHYKSFPFASVLKWANGEWGLKTWLKCPVDGLRYYY